MHAVAEAANTTAVVLSWIVSLCVVRSVFIVVEQPINSMLYHVPALSRSLIIADARRFVTHLWKFGGSSANPLELYLNVLASMADSRLNAWTFRRRKKTKLKSLAPAEGVWVNGKKPALKDPAAYPSKIALAIAETAQLCVASVSAASASGGLAD